MSDLLAEIEALKQELVFNPSSADHHYRLGVLYEEAEDDEQALNHLQHAATLAPEDPYPVVALGQMYARSKQTEKALVMFGQAQQLGGGSPEVMYAIATGLHDLYKYREAAEAYKKVVALEPDNLEAHYALGQLSLQLGDLTQAVHSLQAVVAEVRDNPEVWNNLARALERSGQLRQAAECYQSMLNEGMATDEVYDALGRTLHRMARLMEAIAAYQQVPEMRLDNLPGRFGLARAQLEVGDTAGAHATFRAAQAVLANRSESHLFQGLTYLLASAHDRALGEYEAALALDPADLEANSRIGHCYVLLEQPAEAMAAFKKAISGCSRHVSSLYGLGLVFQARKQPELAVDFFGQALQVNHEYVPALRAIAALSIGPLGRMELILDTLDEVLDTHPQELRSRGPIISTWTRQLAQHHFDVAAGLANRLAKKFPGDLTVRGEAALYTSRAHELHQRGHKQEAMDMLKKLLRVQPDNADAKRILQNLAAELQAAAAPPPPEPAVAPAAEA